MVLAWYGGRCGYRAGGCLNGAWHRKQGVRQKGHRALGAGVAAAGREPRMSAAGVQGKHGR